MVREMSPDTEAYVLYKDIRSPGQYEAFYQRAQEDTGIFFTKAEVTGVQNGGRTLRVEAEDTLLGGSIQLEADLVVLATGMVPRSADGEQIRKYVDAKAVVKKGEAGVQLENAKKTVEELALPGRRRDPESQLPTGPGPACLQVRFPRLPLHLLPLREPANRDLPCWLRTGPSGFPDGAGGRDRSSPQGHPGVEVTARGEAVHPRWGDMSFPELRPSALHPVQAVHGGVSVRHHQRGREGNPAAEPHTLPALRDLHGSLPRANHLLQGLFA